MAPTTKELVQRFLFAVGGVAAAWLIVFGRHLSSVRPDVLALIPLGLLLAAMLSLVRLGWMRSALVLALAIVPFRLAYRSPSDETQQVMSWNFEPGNPLGWLLTRLHVGPSLLQEWMTDIVGGLVLGVGVLAIALLYHGLSRQGWRFGKFLVVGPLLGGLYVAMIPIEQFEQVVEAVTGDRLLLGFYIRMVVGDGAGFGAELYDLLSPGTDSMPEDGTDALPGDRAQ